MQMISAATSTGSKSNCRGAPWFRHICTHFAVSCPGLCRCGFCEKLALDDLRFRPQAPDIVDEFPSFHQRKDDGVSGKAARHRDDQLQYRREVRDLETNAENGE